MRLRPLRLVTALALRAGVVLLVLSLVSCTKEARKRRVLNRAETYFNAGQFDQAKVEYLNLLRFDPGSPIPYQRLGVIWSAEGAPLRAAPFLLKSRDLVPDDLENRLKLARVYLALGRQQDAFAEVMNVLERAPNNGDAALIGAEAAQTQDERDRIDQAIAKIPEQNNAPVQLAIATAAARKGDREAAKKAVERALSADPKSAPAHIFMATLWLTEGQAVNAGNEFKLAAELSPPRSVERLRYAQFQIQSGAVDDASKTLRSITTTTPDFLPAWLVLAELSLGKKNYDESIRLLTNILNRDPENIDANILLGRTWMAKGDADKALQTVQRLDARYPDFPPLKLEQARCYLQKNNLPQAITMLNQALSTQPDYVDAALLLGQINLRTGKLKAVVEAMKPLTLSHPGMTAAKLLLADAYRGLGQLDDAANIFREQLKASPQDAEACLALGVILRQQKKDDEARQMLERARDLAPSNPLPLVQLVDLDLGHRDFETAHRRVEEQLQTTPNSPMLHYLEGKVYVAEAKWDLAEASLNKALNLNRDFSGAYELLATVYTASNKWSDAARELEAVIKRAPNETRALMSLGVLYDKLRNFEKARDVYEKVLTLAPESAPALNNLAFIYAEQLNQLDRAYQLAQKARRLLPGDGSVADTLGWVFYRKRDYPQAIGLLTEAADKSPGDPQIRYHVGMCYYMMGEAEAARTAFDQALNSPFDFADKADAQRRLALLSEAQINAALKREDLEALVHQQPDDLLARIRLAERYEAGHLFKEAVAQYQEVLKLNPRFITAVVKLAEIYSNELNDQEKALEYAKSARDLSPGDAHISLLVGRIAYKAANYTWAYSLLKQASDELPHDSEALHALGWAAFSLGKIVEATDCMERLARMAPTGPLAEDAKRWLALMQIGGDGSPARATIEEVDRALKKDPNYAPALLAQAAIAANNGDANRAISLYQQVLTRFPEYGPAQKRLAMLYAQVPTDLPKAYEFASKARKSLPNDVELTRILAEISYQRKDYARALEFLAEAARKEPLDANHLYYLGICSLQTKDPEHARAALNQALANGLQDPLASDAKRALQDIKQD